MFDSPHAALRFILTQTNSSRRALVNKAAQEITVALEAGTVDDTDIIESLKADKARLEELVSSLQGELATLKASPSPVDAPARRTRKKKEEDADEEDST